jgi:hypothetical protein
MKQPKLKRLKREEPTGHPYYGWRTRWVVYEAEAKKAIEKAYMQGRADAIRDARAARS